MTSRRARATIAGLALLLAAAGGDVALVPAALPGAPAFPAALRAELADTLAARGPDYVPRTRHRRDDGSPIYSNRLLFETSPYLQQHAHNPVNWYPWGDEAFATARRLGRPVLVSIGYSTCHWCHVMEEESFDDAAIAEQINAGFIAIKVDREARPDVDAIYMNALHAMQSRGGWPLNVWLTPEGKPFYGGTYFPPTDRPGRPGLPTVLSGLRERYEQDPERITGIADELARQVRENLSGSSADASRAPDEDMLELAAKTYRRRWDREWGGVGPRPKFPSSLPVRFLLRYHRRTGDEDALRAATLTLEKMAAGGMYDHVGGGFHRYATDQRWLVPHFEKMLYDNALLATTYLEAWQLTGREDFARVTRDVLDYLQHEMMDPGGGFYSATDADSRNAEGEMEEGFFFTWTREEIEEILGDDADPVAGWFGVTRSGNFEGRNILHTWGDAEVVAGAHGISSDELARMLERARPKLRAGRTAERAAPLRDDKVLVAWNGLAISAFARAGLALGEPEYVLRAARAADFVLRRMRRDDRLHRVWMNGRASGPAFLDDYAFFIAALLDLYEAAPDPRWLREALALQEVLDARHADAAGGGYFRTADDGETLLAREKPAHDGAVPSGNSVAALNLLRLWELTGEDRYETTARMLFSAFHDALTRGPTGLSEMLLAVDYRLDAVKEVILVRPAAGGDLEAMLAPIRSTYLPNRVLAVVAEGEDLEAHAQLVPLLRGKRAQRGKVTAYVCEDRVCKFPTADPAKLAEQLARVKPLGAPEDAPGN